MRKYIFSVLIALLSLPVIAQQQQSQAKVVLDKTAEAFRKCIILRHITPLRLPVKPSDQIRGFQYEFLTLQLNSSALRPFCKSVCHRLYNEISLHAACFTKCLSRLIKNNFNAVELCGEE